MEPVTKLTPFTVSIWPALMPPSNDEVAVTVERRVPPVKVRPAEEDRPAPETAPVKVEVAEPVTARLVVVALVKAVEEASKKPAGPTLKSPTTVDEALETKPAAWVSRSAT